MIRKPVNPETFTDQIGELLEPEDPPA